MLYFMVWVGEKKKFIQSERWLLINFDCTGKGHTQCLHPQVVKDPMTAAGVTGRSRKDVARWTK